MIDWRRAAGLIPGRVGVELLEPGDVVTLDDVRVEVVSVRPAGPVVRVLGRTVKGAEILFERPAGERTEVE